MAAKQAGLSLRALSRLFGPREATVLERRVMNLPVAVERRQGPSCDNCGFGSLHTVPAGRPQAGMLRCDRPGCGYVRESEVVLRADAPLAAVN